MSCSSTGPPGPTVSEYSSLATGRPPSVVVLFGGLLLIYISSAHASRHGHSRFVARGDCCERVFARVTHCAVGCTCMDHLPASGAQTKMTHCSPLRRVSGVLL